VESEEPDHLAALLEAQLEQHSAPDPGEVEPMPDDEFERLAADDPIAAIMVDGKEKA